MSLVSTHHNLLIKNKTFERVPINSIGKLATEITFQVIKENSNLISEVDLGISSKDVLKALVIEIIDKMNLTFNRDEIIKNVFNYMFGYGILQEYIENDEISDIDGSRYNFFTIKKNGIKEKISIKFSDEKEFEKYCKLVVIRNGGVINENDSHSRVVDMNYRLRINVTISPRSITGPSISIRKHRKNSFCLDDLEKLNMFESSTKNFLKSIMRGNARVIISGKGGAGKTTLLRALLMEISEMESILVCEKETEMFLESSNIIIHKIRKGKEKKNDITLKDLISDGLTMSLNGYCIGEIIGDEAWEFIKAGHTDHKIFGTIHSNSEEDVVPRLIMLIENITNLSERRVEKIIYQSLDYIIHLNNFKIVRIVKIVFRNDKYEYYEVS